MTNLGRKRTTFTLQTPMNLTFWTSSFLRAFCVGAATLALYCSLRSFGGLSRLIAMDTSVHINVLTADIKSLQMLLGAHKTTSQYLVELYLGQINKHDNYLHAMIQTAPRDQLLSKAKELDEERKSGKSRGPLHGIPILIKVCLLRFPLLLK